jgi:hypothetical protein
MDGLRSELRRLGMASTGANRMMAKADRDEYTSPRPPPIASVTVITHGGFEDEHKVQQALAIIATAYRKGTLTETQAQALVNRLSDFVKK